MKKSIAITAAVAASVLGLSACSVPAEEESTDVAYSEDYGTDADDSDYGYEYADSEDYGYETLPDYQADLVVEAVIEFGGTSSDAYYYIDMVEQEWNDGMSVTTCEGYWTLDDDTFQQIIMTAANETFGYYTAESMGAGLTTYGLALAHC